jgi:hypothetical protein
MKLNEIKNVTKGGHYLGEGVIPIHITMTLEQIIDAGKVTNNVQYFVMASLISHFKNGSSLRWPRDLNSYSMNANAAMIDAVKNLTPEESVEMANWLLDSLNQSAKAEAQKQYVNQDLDTIDWVKWVLRRQD